MLFSMEVDVGNSSTRSHRFSATHALRILIFVAVMGGLFACKAPEWKQFSHPEDGVAFSLPSDPVMKEETFEGNAGHGVSHTYRTETDFYDSSIYGVAVTTYTTKLDVKVSLDNMKNRLTQDGKKKIVKEVPITLQGYPGIEYELQGADIHEKLRYYIVNNRVIGIFVIIDIEDSFPVGMERFFSSLRLDAAK